MTDKIHTVLIIGATRSIGRLAAAESIGRGYDTRVRIALMTSIGVTNHGSYAPADWKRRGERLVRVSGLPYTIVRPGWFDYNKTDQHSLVMLQGDRRWSGTPEDGSVSRRQIAQVLVASLSSDAAEHKTLELISEKGFAQTDLEPLFSALKPDESGDLDAVDDMRNLPVDGEPVEVRCDIETIRTGIPVRN